MQNLIISVQQIFYDSVKKGKKRVDYVLVTLRIRLPLQIVKFTTTLQLLISFPDYLKAGVWNIRSASEIKYSSLRNREVIFLL